MTYPSPAVVGVDIGGTKTHLATAHADGPLHEAIVPTSSWRTADPVRDAESLAGLIGAHLGEEARSRPAAFGAHGCDSTGACRALARELARHLDGPVRVVNDAELMPWAMGVSGGIGVVAGTGSIAVARDGADQLITSGGWGWVLGDEGGAAGIVREAVRAVLAELDADRRGDRLVAALFDGFGVVEGPALSMALSRRSSADWWGSHAGLVFDAADAGSPLARRVVEEAADRLAGLVGRLLARGVRADHVVAGGGVVVAQPRLRERFVAVLGRDHPDLAVSVLDRPPVTGAIALAVSLVPQQEATS